MLTFSTNYTPFLNVVSPFPDLNILSAFQTLFEFTKKHNKEARVMKPVQIHPSFLFGPHFARFGHFKRKSSTFVFEGINSTKLRSVQNLMLSLPNITI